MIVVAIAPDGEVGCTIVLEAWTGAGTPAASYAMTEVSPTVYESANIAGLTGIWRVRMRNGDEEPVATGYVTFSSQTRGHLTDSPMESSVVSVNVLPLNAAVQSRIRGTTIEVFSGESVQVSIAVVDAAGTAVSLAGRTLRIVLESAGSVIDKSVIEDGSIARSGNTITFTISGGTNGQRRLWSLRDTAGEVVLAHGVVSTLYVPKKDS